MSQADFAGRVALVTGGADGMGWAAVQRFAARGAAVAICDTNVSLAQQRVASLTAMGASARFFETQVGDPDSCEQAVRGVVAELGRLDFAFNNAGYRSEERRVGKECA